MGEVTSQHSETLLPDHVCPSRDNQINNGLFLLPKLERLPLSAYVRPKAVSKLDVLNGQAPQYRHTSVQTLPKSSISSSTSPSPLPKTAIQDEEDPYTDYKTIVRLQERPTRKVDIIQVEETREDETGQLTNLVIRSDAENFSVGSGRESSIELEGQLRRSPVGGEQEDLDFLGGRNSSTSGHLKQMGFGVHELRQQTVSRQPLKGVPGVFASLEPNVSRTVRSDVDGVLRSEGVGTPTSNDTDNEVAILSDRTAFSRPHNTINSPSTNGPKAAGGTNGMVSEAEENGESSR